MSDIVEMLRTPTGCVPPSEWELKAAKEIERLRTALRRIRSLDKKNVSKHAQIIAVQALALSE
jgi:hypothetical protein